MNQHNLSNGGKAPKIVDLFVVALYDSGTGMIRHVHTVTMFEGGGRVDEQEVVRRASDKASKAGHNTANLKIKISKDADHGRRPHRIDLKTGEFVRVEMKRRRST